MMAALSIGTSALAAMPTSAQTASTGGGPLTPQAGSLAPSGGMIRALTGDVGPLAGNSKAYWGDADPMGQNLSTFWGSLQPYGGMIRANEGSLTEMGGMIRALQGDLSGMGGMIRANAGDLSATAGMIRAHEGDNELALADYRSFVAKSEAFWATAVQAATGKSFSDAFATPLLAKYGIDLNNPASLASLSADRREMFFLEWHDGLMQYSGADQVDHWMKEINWTPKLTQQQGSGARAVIGLVDFFVANDPDIKSKVVYSGGYTEFTGHGAGVASLILASHDGKGIMGIAPNARVAAFNPFDATRTASWADVTRGITEVSKAGASVINLSLGVPGWTFHPEWRNVFMNATVNLKKDSTVYVIAAGNSGTVQTQNVEMGGALDNTFLLVGSIGPDGKISSFSNQPGWACLTENGACKNSQQAGVGATGNTFLKADYLGQSGLLMNRFLVAPGELILVADGNGGVTRMSGTSFAAPLVAGAIALIQDRWPWLKNYPRDVANILLNSATDLGAPGADPVYGRGLLNIEAAQSVLDFDKLSYELWNGTTKTTYKVETLKSTGIQSIWAQNDMYFAAFEKLSNSQRDFLIPLSTRLFGTMKNGQYFQEFVYNHFVNWLATGSGFASSTAPRFGFSGLSETPMAAGTGGWSFNMAARMVTSFYGKGSYSPAKLRSSVTVRSPADRFSFSFGSGDGAMSLGARSGLQTSDDFDPYSGGTNPLLGFASGGTHFSSAVALGSGLAISAGTTQQKRPLERELEGAATIQDRTLIRQAGRYGASAFNLRVDYRPVRWLGVSAGITRLDENRAFMGVRSLTASDFGRGTATDGLTLQGDLSVTDGLTFFGSATRSRSSSMDQNAALRIGKGGVTGSAYQLGLAAKRVLNDGDQVRLSFSQPLTIESGKVEFTSVMVVDRETGETGLVTQSFDAGPRQRRRAVAEVMYGAPLLQGRAQLSLFGRSELRRIDAGTPQLMLGAQAKLAL
jgi:subtilisin family serine protease